MPKPKNMALQDAFQWFSRENLEQRSLIFRPRRSIPLPRKLRHICLYFSASRAVDVVSNDDRPRPRRGRGRSSSSSRWNGVACSPAQQSSRPDVRVTQVSSHSTSQQYESIAHTAVQHAASAHPGDALTSSQGPASGSPRPAAWITARPSPRFAERSERRPSPMARIER